MWILALLTHVSLSAWDPWSLRHSTQPIDLLVYFFEDAFPDIHGKTPWLNISRSLLQEDNVTHTLTRQKKEPLVIYGKKNKIGDQLALAFAAHTGDAACIVLHENKEVPCVTPKIYQDLLRTQIKSTEIALPVSHHIIQKLHKLQETDPASTKHIAKMYRFPEPSSSSAIVMYEKGTPLLTKPNDIEPITPEILWQEIRSRREPTDATESIARQILTSMLVLDALEVHHGNISRHSFIVSEKCDQEETSLDNSIYYPHVDKVPQCIKLSHFDNAYPRTKATNADMTSEQAVMHNVFEAPERLLISATTYYKLQLFVMQEYNKIHYKRKRNQIKKTNLEYRRMASEVFRLRDSYSFGMLVASFVYPWKLLSMRNACDTQKCVMEKAKYIHTIMTKSAKEVCALDAQSSRCFLEKVINQTTGTLPSSRKKLTEIQKQFTSRRHIQESSQP